MHGSSMATFFARSCAHALPRVLWLDRDPKRPGPTEHAARLWRSRAKTHGTIRCRDTYRHYFDADVLTDLMSSN
jgi:hypothetical protein